MFNLLKQKNDEKCDTLNSQYLLIHTWYLWNFLKLKNITSRKTLWTFEISEDVAAFFEKPNANDTTNVSVST